MKENVTCSKENKTNKLTKKHRTKQNSALLSEQMWPQSSQLISRRLQNVPGDALDFENIISWHIFYTDRRGPVWWVRGEVKSMTWHQAQCTNFKMWYNLVWHNPVGSLSFSLVIAAQIWLLFCFWLVFFIILCSFIFWSADTNVKTMSFVILKATRACIYIWLWHRVNWLYMQMPVLKFPIKLNSALKCNWSYVPLS